MSTRQLRPRAPAVIPQPKLQAPRPTQPATPVSPPDHKRAASPSAAPAASHKKPKLEPTTALPSPPETPLIGKRASGKVKAEQEPAAVGGADENTPVGGRGGAKRGRAQAGVKLEAEQEGLLVHDGGKVAKVAGKGGAGSKRAKKAPAASKVNPDNDDDDATAPASTKQPKPRAHPKAALLASIHHSPFPTFKNPPSSQYYEVTALLTAAHGYSAPPSRPKELVDLPGAGAGCGQVPFVLDGLCRTIISQSVTSASAKRVKDALDEAYGRGDYRAMLEGGEARLMEVVGVGGLRKKGSWIFNILKWVDERQGGEGVLSLEWLRDKTDDEILEVFLGFQGVGLKTAYCMLLLNIGRERMAVDTHVWRLSKQLGWCPQSATADQCAIHLDNSIPDELKYQLHILLWREGKGCKRCAVGGRTSLDLAHTVTGVCPIEKFCKREKGAGPAKKVAKKEEEGQVVAKEEDAPAEVVAEMEEEKPEVDGVAYVEH